MTFKMINKGIELHSKKNIEVNQLFSKKDLR